MVTLKVGNTVLLPFKSVKHIDFSCLTMNRLPNISWNRGKKKSPTLKIGQWLCSTFPDGSFTVRRAAVNMRLSGRSHPITSFRAIGNHEKWNALRTIRKCIFLWFPQTATLLFNRPLRFRTEIATPNRSEPHVRLHFPFSLFADARGHCAPAEISLCRVHGEKFIYKPQNFVSNGPPKSSIFNTERYRWHSGHPRCPVRKMADIWLQARGLAGSKFDCKF